MEITEQIAEQYNEFILNVNTMPRDEIAAYLSILIGLVLIITAFLIW